jgi:hypothetical protein
MDVTYDRAMTKPLASSYTPDLVRSWIQNPNIPAPVNIRTAIQVIRLFIDGTLKLATAEDVCKAYFGFPLSFVVSSAVEPAEPVAPAKRKPTKRKPAKPAKPEAEPAEADKADKADEATKEK